MRGQLPQADFGEGVKLRNVAKEVGLTNRELMGQRTEFVTRRIGLLEAREIGFGPTGRAAEALEYA